MSRLNDAYERGYADAPTLAKHNTNTLAAKKAAELYNQADLQSAYRDGRYAATCDAVEAGGDL